MLLKTLFIALGLTFSVLTAQKADCFYDKNWKPTIQEKASYYRINTKLKENYYKVEDFFMSGKLQMLSYTTQPTCDDSNDNPINETTWYDEDGSKKSYEKYNENGEIVVRIDYSDFGEQKTEYIDGETLKSTLIDYKTNFKKIEDYTKGSDNEYSKLYYKDKLLCDFYTIENNEYLYKNRFGKFYDFDGKLLFELKENDKVLKNVEYYNNGILVTYFTKEEEDILPIKQELLDKKGKLISTSTYKNGEPYNGEYIVIDNFLIDGIVTVQNGNIVSKKNFYTNGSLKNIEYKKSEYETSKITYYNKQGKELGSLIYNEDGYSPKEGTQYNSEILIATYKDDVLQEEYRYYDKTNDIYIENFYPTKEIASKNLVLIESQKDGIKKFFNQKGELLGILTLKLSYEEYGNYKNWIPYDGKDFYNHDFILDDNFSYKEYKKGEVVYEIDYSTYSEDNVIKTEITYKEDNSYLQKIYKNNLLLQENNYQNYAVIAEKNYDENGKLQSEYTSEPKNGTLITYNESYTNPIVVTTYQNGDLTKETLYIEINDNHQKVYDYQNNQVQFYGKENNPIAKAEVKNKKPYNGKVVLYDNYTYSSLDFDELKIKLPESRNHNYLDDDNYSVNSEAYATEISEREEPVRDVDETTYAYDSISVGYYENYDRYYIFDVKNGKLHGEAKQYDIKKDQLIYTAHFSEGKLNGKYEEYNLDGEIICYNNYIDGELNGETYYKDKYTGEEYHCDYKEGKAYNGMVVNGENLSTYDNGILTRKIFDYKNEENSLTFTRLNDKSYKAESYKNGEKFAEFITNEIEYFYDVYLNGEVKFFQNNNYIFSAFFEKGLLTKGKYVYSIYNPNYAYEDEPLEYNKIIISCEQLNNYTFQYYDEDKLMGTSHLSSDFSFNTDLLDFINHVSIGDFLQISGSDY